MNMGREGGGERCEETWTGEWCIKSDRQSPVCMKLSVLRSGLCCCVCFTRSHSLLWGLAQLRILACGGTLQVGSLSLLSERLRNLHEQISEVRNIPFLFISETAQNLCCLHCTIWSSSAVSEFGRTPWLRARNWLGRPVSGQGTSYLKAQMQGAWGGKVT